MARHSNKERILSEGLRVVHARGFGGASVRDIVQAAGVPQGSFSNHFATKDAFGLEVIELYFAGSRGMIAATLENEAIAPLKRVRAYIDANIEHIQQSEMRNGCLFGNLTAEGADLSEPMRLRLAEIFQEVQLAIERCLRAAAKDGSLPPRTKFADIAGFIVSSLQGAILLAKAERSSTPVERFKQILFSTVLR